MADQPNPMANWWKQNPAQTIEDINSKLGRQDYGASLQSLQNGVNQVNAALYGPSYNSASANPLIGSSLVQQVATTGDQTLQTMQNVRDMSNGRAYDMNTAIAQASNDEWAAFTAGGFAGSASYNTLLARAGVAGAAIAEVGCMRTWLNLNFFVAIPANSVSGDTPYVNGFVNADPSNLLPGESDYDMLNRLYPGEFWEEHLNGSAFPGLVKLNADDSVVTYIYSPLEGDIVQKFYHLWDYTPSSGPPTRNGITDFIKILSLLPLQY